MRKTNIIFITSIAVLCLYSTSRAAQNSPTLGSKYGLIQGVKNYSSAPYWNPNSPYNARIPTPIYATGTDVTTGDCNTMVDTLITSFCSERNSCSGLQLKDVRPTIMIQLAEVKNHNYATACGGYIDGAFEKYKNGGRVTGNTTSPSIAFPTPTTNKTIEIQNPFVQKPSEYQVGVAERAAELKELQAQTAVDPSLKVAEFPKTIRDLSLTDRTAILADGYEPYRGLNAYETFGLKDWEDDEAFNARKDAAKTRWENEHKRNIHYYYVNLNNKGKDSTAPAGCPDTYFVGVGVTVSCVPSAEGAEFKGWCTDAALTATNCSDTITIPPTANEDISLFAKWECTSPDYEMDLTTHMCKEKGKHKIDYIVDYATVDTSCPTSYREGTGTIIPDACKADPNISRCPDTKFMGWTQEPGSRDGTTGDCTLTILPYTIDASDTTDYTFYACWKCDPDCVWNGSNCMQPGGGDVGGDDPDNAIIPE